MPCKVTYQKIPGIKHRHFAGAIIQPTTVNILVFHNHTIGWFGLVKKAVFENKET